MSFEEDFGRALAETTIHRGRRSRLLTVGTTELPYVLLNRSRVNRGDTVVRRGVLRVEEPALLLLHRPHQFEGFSDDEGEGDRRDAMVAVGRLAHFPPAQYTNKQVQMDVLDGDIEQVLKQVDRSLDDERDERTGLITGPVEVWHFSLLVYVAQQIRESAGADVGDLARRLRGGNN